MGNPSMDVLVIGGGVVGLCAAYYCACRGASVTLLERDDMPSKVASSHGNAGLLVPSHCQPLPTPAVLAEGMRQLLTPAGSFTIKPRPDPALAGWLWRFRRHCTERHLHHAVEIFKELSAGSYGLHRELAREAGDAYEYGETGLLNLYTSKEGFDAGLEEAALMERHGIASRPLTSSQVLEMVPEAGPNVVGGILNPPDGRLDPAAFCRWLARRIEEKGGRILSGAEVYGFEATRKTVFKALTTRGELAGEQIVLAAGAWTPVLARKLGVRLPVEAGKGYSFTFAHDGRVPPLPLLLEEARAVVTPYASRLRMTGVLELSGLDRTIDRRRLENIRRKVGEALPRLQGLELREIWRGFRPCTPDGLPFLGRVPPFANLWTACGHATKGVFLGPITGRIASELLAGESVGSLERHLRVKRF